MEVDRDEHEGEGMHLVSICRHVYFGPFIWCFFVVGTDGHFWWRWCQCCGNDVQLVCKHISIYPFLTLFYCRNTTTWSLMMTRIWWRYATVQRGTVFNQYVSLVLCISVRLFVSDVLRITGWHYGYRHLIYNTWYLYSIGMYSLPVVMSLSANLFCIMFTYPGIHRITCLKLPCVCLPTFCFVHYSFRTLGIYCITHLKSLCVCLPMFCRVLYFSLSLHNKKIHWVPWAWSWGTPFA